LLHDPDPLSRQITLLKGLLALLETVQNGGKGEPLSADGRR
jgi:hypothetical protein